MVLLALLSLAALVVAIIAVTQSSQLKLVVEELSRRVNQLAQGSVARTPSTTSATPPPLPKSAASTPAAPASPPPVKIRALTPMDPTPSLDWESIVCVKLFAWIGGLAFFLGVVFFVKYAFDNNLITPVMRVVM